MKKPVSVRKIASLTDKPSLNQVLVSRSLLARTGTPFAASREARTANREAAGEARRGFRTPDPAHVIRRDHGAKMTGSPSSGGRDQECHRRPGHNPTEARRSIEALPRGREVSVRSAIGLRCGKL